MSTIKFKLPTEPRPSAPPRYTRGSFDQDWKSGRYSLCWESWAEFDAWRSLQERTKVIELRRKECRQPKCSNAWTEKHLFVCARQGTGGIKSYKRKTDWARNVKSKR